MKMTHAYQTEKYSAKATLACYAGPEGIKHLQVVTRRRPRFWYRLHWPESPLDCSVRLLESSQANDANMHARESGEDYRWKRYKTLWDAATEAA